MIGKRNTIDGRRVRGWPQLLLAVTLVLLLLPALAGAQPIHLPVSPVPTSAPWDLQRTLAFTHINAADHGLSSNLVERIVQDDAGFMWFSTLNGLNRYDGSEIVVYRNEPADPTSLSGNVIRSMYLDRGGMLWVGTSSGLNAYDRRTDRFTRYLHDPTNPYSLGSGEVRAIYQDHAGTLWVGTVGSGLNRFDPATGSFTHYQHSADNIHSLSDNDVQALLEDSTGVFWVGTDGGGLNRFDPATGDFVAYRHDKNDPRSLSGDSVQDLVEDRSGQLWIATPGSGLSRLDRANGHFTSYHHDPADSHSLNDDQVLSIAEDSSGALWVGTFSGGLNILDTSRQQFFAHPHDASDPDSLSHNRVIDIYPDRSGLIWVATEGGGVNVYNPKQQAFTVYGRGPNDPAALASDPVTAVYESGDGTLWVGTASGDLARVDRRTGQVRHYPLDPAHPQAQAFPTILDILGDNDGALWLATYGGGLYHLDPTTGTLTNYQHDPANPRSLSNDYVTAVRQDRGGRLWLATTGGGINSFDPTSASFTSYRFDPADPQSLSGDFLDALAVDRQGMIWGGTRGSGLNRLDPATGQVTRFQHDQQNPASLGSDFVFDVYVDRSGEVWIGTFGGGLDRFDPATGNFVHYGLADDAIGSVVEEGAAGATAAGNLWIVRSRTLAKLDRRSQTIQIFDSADGLPRIDFTRGAFVSASGDMLIGGLSGGLLAFNPADVPHDLEPPPVVLTSLLLNNKPVAIGVSSVLRQAIDESDSITLSYADRVVSFGFAGLNYRAPRQNRYRYQLEGFDTEWIEVDSTRRLATYTNLPPGQYVFRVTAANADGVWNETGRTLPITVTAPWWQMLWFRSLAVLLGVAVGFTAYRWRVHDIAARNRMLEAQVAARTRELSESNTALEQTNTALIEARGQAEAANTARSRFLATMSHELRTPLNAIIGFAQILARSRDPAPSHVAYAAIIERNGDHLLSLINTVLDISKIEAGRMTLHKTMVDLEQLLAELEGLFQHPAADKGLRLRIERAANLPRSISADQTRLRQVLINLLGNAVKFTEAGEVTLRVRTADDRPSTADHQTADLNASSVVGGRGSVIIFEVADTGPGIIPEEQERIFDAFVQSEAGALEPAGAGLGLAISRQFVQLMGGTLVIHSQPGHGATFSVTIPVEVVGPIASEVEPARRHVVGREPGLPRYRILIADDQPDNRELLVTLLNPLNFDLREAGDGIAVLANWREWRPHLIWIDLHMPLLDGARAAKQIKAEAREQAPIIIALSASSLEEERAGVLASGCDDYLRKPFHADDIFAALSRHLGIRFTYEEVPPTAADRLVTNSGSRAEALDPAALAALPDDLLAQLEQGAVETDPEALARVIAQIRIHDTRLADSLAALAEEFAYRQILASIPAARGDHV